MELLVCENEMFDCMKDMEYMAGIKLAEDSTVLMYSHVISTKGHGTCQIACTKGLIACPKHV
jgi:hypothetical protein